MTDYAHTLIEMAAKDRDERVARVEALQREIMEIEDTMAALGHRAPATPPRALLPPAATPPPPPDKVPTDARVAGRLRNFQRSGMNGLEWLAVAQREFRAGRAFTVPELVRATGGNGNQASDKATHESARQMLQEFVSLGVASRSPNRENPVLYTLTGVWGPPRAHADPPAGTAASNVDAAVARAVSGAIRAGWVRESLGDRTIRFKHPNGDPGRVFVCPTTASEVELKALRNRMRRAGAPFA